MTKLASTLFFLFKLIENKVASTTCLQFECNLSALMQVLEVLVNHRACDSLLFIRKII